MLPVIILIRMEKFFFSWSLAANSAVESWASLIRPVAGRLMGRTEIYGQRKDRWIAHLLNKMEAKVIPPWVSGKETEGFKVLSVWG